MATGPGVDRERLRSDIRDVEHAAMDAIAERAQASLTASRTTAASKPGSNAPRTGCRRR